MAVSDQWWQWPALAILATVIVWLIYTMERERKTNRDTMREERDSLRKEMDEIATERKEHTNFIQELVRQNEVERVKYLASLNAVVTDIRETMTGVTVSLTKIAEVQAILCATLQEHDKTVQDKLQAIRDGLPKNLPKK